MFGKTILLIFLLSFFAVCFLYKGKIMSQINSEITLTSSAFEKEQNIPTKYTCDGQDISPPLSWSNIPDGTKSFAIICDDPDAPGGTWVHWIIFNIPANKTELNENVAKQETFADDTKQGTNSFGNIGYGGPCPPPSAAHRYFFKIYALGKTLDLLAGATKKQLTDAIQRHILAKGQLMGKYKR